MQSIYVQLIDMQSIDDQLIDTQSIDRLYIDKNSSINNPRIIIPIFQLNCRLERKERK